MAQCFGDRGEARINEGLWLAMENSREELSEQLPDPRELGRLGVWNVFALVLKGLSHLANQFIGSKWLLQKVNRRLRLLVIKNPGVGISRG